MSTPEQVPNSRRGRRSFRGKPKTFLELIAWVLDDSARTLRAGVLIATTGACIAGVFFVIQLQPERWAYVTGAAVVVIAITHAIRRRKDERFLRDIALMAGENENLGSENPK